MIKELLKKAIEYYDAGNTDKAMELFKKVLTLSPTNKIAVEYIKMGGSKKDETTQNETKTQGEEKDDEIEAKVINNLFKIFSDQNEGKTIDPKEIDGVIAMLERYKNII